MALIGLVLVALLSVGYGFLQGRDTERRQQVPVSFSTAAKADAEKACAGRDVEAAYDCVYERVEASREQARSELDLVAQQRAAFASLASAWVALLTLVATLIGLWFIKGTLEASQAAVREAEKGAEAAREAVAQAREGVIATEKIGKAQVRAYVSIKLLESELRNTKDLWFRFSYKNSGQSPAINVQFFYISRKGPYENHWGIAPVAEVAAGADGELDATFVLDDVAASFLSGMSEFLIVAHYFDVFETEHHDVFPYHFGYAYGKYASLARGLM